MKNKRDGWNFSFDFGEEDGDGVFLSGDGQRASGQPGITDRTTTPNSDEPRQTKSSDVKPGESFAIVGSSISSKAQPTMAKLGNPGLTLANSDDLRPTRDNSAQPKQRPYGKLAAPQPYLPGSEEDAASMFFGIDPPKRRNAGYRVRRELRQESLIDMPMVITAIELRAGVAEDDRAWNRKFNALRDEFIKEISYLPLVIGDRLRLELTWQLPINWPICALRAPDGKRLVDTDSNELRSYGARAASVLWKSIVAKQRELQAMARNYEALVRWSGKLAEQVAEAMKGAKNCRLILDPEIHKQINSLQWPKHHRDNCGEPYCPLPFNVAESLRVRLWAYVKAVKQHVHAMNFNYNRVTNERRLSLGKTRPAALAVGILDGKCRTPQHYWALWVRKGQKNLFYRTVTPRVVSSARGKYITPERFAVADKQGRLRTEAIDRCHMTHMKDIYRAADHVLHQLLALSEKTAALIVQTMGKRHGRDSPAASGRNQWRGSGKFFRWFDLQ